MLDIKKPVKEVAVYDGSSWDRYDIGAKAENVSLSNINIGTNVNSAFNTLIGSNTLTDGKIVITDNQQHITTSNVNSSLLGGLSDTIIIENQGTLDNNVIIKKLKQNGTNNIICPESKTSAIYMSDNETTLDNYLGTITGTIGNTDISSIGNGTITGAIGDTDISSIGNGTITGAINTLNINLNPVVLYKANNFIDQENITLSQDAFNFDRIVIHYSSESYHLNSVTVYLNSKYTYYVNNWIIPLTVTMFAYDNSNVNIKSKMYSLKRANGTILERVKNSQGNWGYNGQVSIRNGGNTITSGGGFISIISVIGYYI